MYTLSFVQVVDARGLDRPSHVNDTNAGSLDLGLWAGRLDAGIGPSTSRPKAALEGRIPCHQMLKARQGTRGHDADESIEARCIGRTYHEGVRVESSICRNGSVRREYSDTMKEGAALEEVPSKGA